MGELKVMVLDNDELIHTLVKDFVNYWYHGAVTVKGIKIGAGFLDEIDEFKPDAIFIDISLGAGIIDGFEVLRKVNQEFEGIEIILCSGKGEMPSSVNLEKMGVFGSVSKPFNPVILKDLFDKVEEKIRLKREEERKLYCDSDEWGHQFDFVPDSSLIQELDQYFRKGQFFLPSDWS